MVVQMIHLLRRTTVITTYILTLQVKDVRGSQISVSHYQNKITFKQTICFNLVAGIDFKTRELVTANQKRVKVQLWDLVGQGKYLNITKSYYRGAHCVLLIFDVTSQQSFMNIRNWLNQVVQFASDDIIKILVANKSSQMVTSGTNNQ